MNVGLATLVLMGAAVLGSGVPTPWHGLSEPEREAVLQNIRDRPLPERLLEISARFLDVPYVFSPLGEGDGKDPDPPFRLDAADCLSLVEESLAMALASSPSQIPDYLAAIRYGPEQSYEGRNHLMEAQWLPHLNRLGLLTDVTARFGGRDTRETRTVLTEASWRSPSSQALLLPKERQVVGTFSFRIIPLDRVLERLRSVPAGTLLVVVREERPFKVTRMTHLGFVVQRGRTYLRHASKSRHHRVVDEDLGEFLARNARYDKWPVTGVSLFEVHEPGGPLTVPPRLPPPAPLFLLPEPPPPVHSAAAPAPLAGSAAPALQGVPEP
jgi:hypothetical protein